MIEFHPATESQLQDIGIPQLSGRAVVAMDEAGVVVAVGGVGRLHGHLVAFMRSAYPNALRNRRTWVRAARAFRDLLDCFARPVFAEADPNIPGSDTLLKHLGFVACGSGWVKWPN